MTTEAPAEGTTGPGGTSELRGLAARMVRAIRYERRISQRELAVLAKMPRATIGRIESGAVSPRVDTLSAVLAGAGFTLALTDHHGRLHELHPEREALIDRAGRHLPSHLRPVPTPAYMGPSADGHWWGWHHIAWPYADDWVPSHTYWRRCTWDVVDERYLAFSHRVWDDAT